MAEAPGVPVRTGWDRVPDALFVGGAVLSSKTLLDFAIAAGFSVWIAWLFPLIIDGFSIYAAQEAADAGAEGRKGARNWAWALVVLFTGLSGALQALDAADHGALAMAGHAVPSLVVLCAFEMRQRRKARFRRSSTPVPAEQPDPSDGPMFAEALRAEVASQLGATMRAEVAAGIRGMVAEELGAVRAEIRRAVEAHPIQAAHPVPELLPAPAHRAPGVGVPNPDVVVERSPAGAPAGAPTRLPSGPPTVATNGVPARSRPRAERQGGRNGQGTSAAEVRARLEAAYATAPSPESWSKRSLGKAAGCGETAALKFLQEQRERTADEASAMVVAGAPGGRA